MLPFLIQASIALDEGVAPVLLQLLQSALCGAKATVAQSSASPAKSRKDRSDKDKDKTEGKYCENDQGQFILKYIMVKRVHSVRS